MGPNALFSSILYFSLLVTLASASPFLSNDIFGAEASSGRALLQAKKACAVDFKHKNYTVLTSQCKGPRYLPKVCCNGLKKVACPVADDINDMSTDCAFVMFSYINLYGKYPPGYFFDNCKEGSQGLDCSKINETS